MSCLNNGVQPPSWTTLFLRGDTARALQLCGVNVAVAGDDIRHANARAPIYVDPLLAACGAGVCVFWEGTNTLIQDGYNADITFAKHYQYCKRRKALGWRVVMGTIANRRYVGYGLEDDGRHEAARLAFNAQVRNTASQFDGVLDVGADETLGADHAAWDSVYFRDGVHLTEVGAARVAAIADRVIAPLITPLMFLPSATTNR